MSVVSFFPSSLFFPLLSPFSNSSSLPLGHPSLFADMLRPVVSDPDGKYPEGVQVKYILLYHVLYEKNEKETGEIRELYVRSLFLYACLLAYSNPSQKLPTNNNKYTYVRLIDTPTSPPSSSAASCTTPSRSRSRTADSRRSMWGWRRSGRARLVLRSTFI